MWDKYKGENGVEIFGYKNCLIVDSCLNYQVSPSAGPYSLVSGPILSSALFLGDQITTTVFPKWSLI